MLLAKARLWIGARKAARRAANEDGTAAVEFALLLPVMITLFFGVVESSMPSTSIRRGCAPTRSRRARSRPRSPRRTPISRSGC